MTSTHTLRTGGAGGSYGFRTTRRLDSKDSPSGKAVNAPSLNACSIPSDVIWVDPGSRRGDWPGQKYQEVFPGMP